MFTQKHNLKRPLRVGRRGFLQPLLVILGCVMFCCGSLDASTVSLAWDPTTYNTDGSLVTDLGGYKLHYGLASGSYSSVIDAGGATSVTISNMEEDRTYFLAVKSYSTSGQESGFSEELSWYSPDVTPPSITGPNSFVLAANSEGLATVPDLRPQMTVSDNISAPANITLTQEPPAGTVIGEGTTPVMITATDEAGNFSSHAINITVTSAPADTQGPVISITLPATTGSFSTTNPVVSLEGTASDNVGVTRVTFSNNRSESGLCSGTANWSIFNVPLFSGENIITITAEDAAGNKAEDVLSVAFNPVYPRLDEAVLRAGMATEEVNIPDNLTPGTTITAQWRILSYVPLVSGMRVRLPDGGPVTNVTLNATRVGVADGRWSIGDRASKIYSFESTWTVPNTPGTCRIRFLSAQQDGYAYMNANIPGGVDPRPYGTDGKEIERDIQSTGSGPDPVAGDTLMTSPPWFDSLSDATLRAGGTVERIEIPGGLQPESTVLCRWDVLSYVPVRSRIRIGLPTQEPIMAEAQLVSESEGRWHIDTYQSKVYTFEYRWTVPADVGTCRIRFINAQADGYAWMNGNIPGGVDPRPYGTDGKEIERDITEGMEEVADEL